MEQTAFQQGFALGRGDIVDSDVTTPRDSSFMAGYAEGAGEYLANREQDLDTALQDQEREYLLVAGEQLTSKREADAYIDGLRAGHRGAIRLIDQYGLPTPKVSPDSADERISTVLAVMDGRLIRATRCSDHPGGHPMPYGEQPREDLDLIRAVLAGKESHDPIRPVVVSRAFEFASLAHEGQRDKAGRPYIEHPLRVSERLGTEDEQAVALLHDVVEDTDAELSDLRAQFSDRIVSAVDALTHRKHEPRDEYIARVVAAGELAMRVKRADVRDNADPERLSALDRETASRLQLKYERTAALLGTTLDDIFAEFPGLLTVC